MVLISFTDCMRVLRDARCPDPRYLFSLDSRNSHKFLVTVRSHAIQRAPINFRLHVAVASVPYTFLCFGAFFRFVLLSFANVESGPCSSLCDLRVRLATATSFSLVQSTNRPMTIASNLDFHISDTKAS